MVIFASDLDNTLLFSYQHRVETDRCVEWLDGREQGFFTRDTPRLLRLLQSQALFIPVTSRSVAQYRRIAFPADCTPEFALTTNGAILLVKGQIDPEWHQESAQAVEPWYGELRRVYEMLHDAPEIKRFRIVDDMYLFAACDHTEDAEKAGGGYLDRTTLDVSVSGRKVYFFPPPIHKGAAVERLRRKFAPEQVIAAGDSVIDVPMLRAADTAILPNEHLMEGMSGPEQCVFDGNGRFPDFILKQAFAYAEGGCRRPLREREIGPSK